jgi:gamma-glutamyltranspeptidase/glutathione hydrolase
MVVSGHPLASRAGAEILARGGNAIDAAVTVGFALAVVLPAAGNIGGGGFLVHRDAVGEVRTLDYRESAPAKATHDMYLDEEGEPTQDSRIGHLSAGVPGSVAGMWVMHQELGSLPWNDLVEPAIELARGHLIDESRHRSLDASKSTLARFAGSAKQFLLDGEAPPTGHQWSQPDLVATLERIGADGADGFYRGETADLLVAEMERGGGLITHEDLETYEALWRDPIRLSYRGHEIFSMPPSSSGGVALAIILNVLGGYDSLPAFGTANLVHLETEAMRSAFIDRNHYLGDPAFVEMPLDRLTSLDHANEWRDRIVRGEAGTTPPFDPAVYESTETTHYSIVDEAGNAASVTTTLNLGYGSGVTVPGAGFLLNDEMDDFAAKPGSPNAYGLVQGEANSVAPGKRMLSSMTPSIVVGPDGDLRMVVGTPGGSTIITSVYHVISNVIDHQLSLAEAVAAPRVHHQALPDVVFFESGGLSPEVVGALEEMGYTVMERESLSGDIAAILADGDGWIGVADPRRGGGAAGF